MGKCIKGVNGMRRESGERGGWGALVFFAIFINRHYSADQVYFMRPIPKNRRIWPRARQSFRFQKSTGTLKINIFFANTFL